jgi:hypothetical protein
VLQGRGHQVLSTTGSTTCCSASTSKACSDSLGSRATSVHGKPLAAGPARRRAAPLEQPRQPASQDNRFERARDLTLINSADNTPGATTTSTDGRYGLHAVFSPRLVKPRGNRLSSTPAPASSCSIRRAAVSLQGNHVAHSG